MNVGRHAARTGSALAGGGAAEGLPVASAQVALIVSRGRRNLAGLTDAAWNICGFDDISEKITVKKMSHFT